MKKESSRPPFALVITAVVLVVIGQLFRPVGGMFISKEALDNDIFLLAIPFLSIFIAIILSFIFCIAMVARALNLKVSRRLYRTIEAVILAGIALGIIGMFQPWVLEAYSIGFDVLLVSTLAFIVWSHVVPRGVRRKQDLGAVSVSEFESKAEDQL
jgi:uncharacterized membrane protein YiaA